MKIDPLRAHLNILGPGTREPDLDADILGGSVGTGSPGGKGGDPPPGPGPARPPARPPRHPLGYLAVGLLPQFSQLSWIQ